MTTSLERCAGGTALTPSTPAVFLPRLSWVTRRTAKHRAASDFIKRRCKLWTTWTLPRSEARKMRVCRRYTTLSKLAPGEVGPVFDWLLGHRVRCLPATCSSSIRVTVPASAYHG